MSTGQTNKNPGFTLLEVMLAVFILGLVATSIYRFVQTTLFAVRVSTVQVRETVLMESFANYLRSLVQSFPPERHGIISGEPHQFDEVSQDELRWITGPGSGLLTRNAANIDWTVTLTTKKDELGIWRQDIEAKNDRTWLPLISGIHGLEVRYFDSRSQEWLDKWTDTVALPSLIRVKLWRTHSNDPYEVVLPLPPVPADVKLPNFNAPQQPIVPVVPGPVSIPRGGNRGTLSQPATGVNP